MWTGRTSCYAQRDVAKDSTIDPGIQWPNNLYSKGFLPSMAYPYGTYRLHHWHHPTFGFSYLPISQQKVGQSAMSGPFATATHHLVGTSAKWAMHTTLHLITKFAMVSIVDSTTPPSTGRLLHLVGVQRDYSVKGHLSMVQS